VGAPDTSPGADFPDSTHLFAIPAEAGTAGSGVPVARERLVARTALIDRLMSSNEPVITVVAPPGYGKSTLLAQWARQLGRVAWVSCEHSDNDPVALWSHVLAALDRIEPVSAQAAALLAASGGEVDIVPRLVTYMSAVRQPVAVVLDHFELVTSPKCTTSIAEFALRVPEDWRLALASRDTVPIPVSRLRVARQIVEIGMDHLAMSTDEAAALLRGAGATVSAAETKELVRRTEGWPAGLYLAALAIKSGAPATGFSFTGDDRLVDDYLRSELLARLSPSQARFLVRTAILDQMSGPLCDAVLGRKGWRGCSRSLSDTTYWWSRSIVAARHTGTTTSCASCSSPSSGAMTQKLSASCIHGRLPGTKRTAWASPPSGTLMPHVTPTALPGSFSS
jgi:LuxR family transcriptional regulator, maltose regulon positive regulatory protein